MIRWPVPFESSWSILADVAGHLQVSEDTVLRWFAKRSKPAHWIWRFKLTEGAEQPRLGMSSDRLHLRGVARGDQALGHRDDRDSKGTGHLDKMACPL